MRRTLKLLGLIGVTAAAGVAAAKRGMSAAHSRQEPAAAVPLPNVSHELREALGRFGDRFGT